jgi:hypothetical protein
MSPHDKFGRRGTVFLLPDVEGTVGGDLNVSPLLGILKSKETGLFGGRKGI